MNNHYDIDPGLTDEIGCAISFFSDEPECDQERPGFILDTKRYGLPMTMVQRCTLFLQNEALLAQLYIIAEKKNIGINTVTDICAMMDITEAELHHETITAWIAVHRLLSNS